MQEIEELEALVRNFHETFETGDEVLAATTPILSKLIQEIEKSELEYEEAETELKNINSGIKSLSDSIMILAQENVKNFSTPVGEVSEEKQIKDLLLKLQGKSLF